MKIVWNKVTWYSKLCAVIFGVGIFFTGFYFGQQFALLPSFGGDTSGIPPVKFTCKQNKSIVAQYTKEKTVHLKLSDGRNVTLMQTVSGSGVRFANSDESFIFWTKGEGAFVEEKGTMTYQDCTTGQ